MEAPLSPEAAPVLDAFGNEPPDLPPFDARNLLRHGGMRPDRDWLQFDCALSYGLVEYLRTLEMLKEHGWSPKRCIPHGGHQTRSVVAIGV